MAHNLSELTFAQQQQFHAYMAAGYTIVIVLANGRLCPGYSDWKLRTTLDRLESRRKDDHD